MKILKVGVVTTVVALAGCMTLEEQLKSSDPTVRARAQQRIVGIALDTNGFTGGAEKDERIAAIRLIDDQDALMRILQTNLNDGRFNGEYWEGVFKGDAEVFGPCIDKLDQAHLVAFILDEEEYSDENYSSSNHRYSKRKQKSNPRDDLDEDAETYSAELFLSVVSSRSLSEILNTTDSAIEYQTTYRSGKTPRLWYAIKRLSDPAAVAICFNKSKSGQVKFAIFPEVAKNWKYVKDKYELAAVLKIACKRQMENEERLARDSKKRNRQKLAPELRVTDEMKEGIVAQISDPKVYAEMLNPKSKFSISDSVVIKDIAAKMPESKVFDLAKKNLEKHSLSDWNYKNNIPFFLAAGAYRGLNDPAKKELLLNMTVSKINEYQSKCRSSMSMIWGDQDRKQVELILAAWGDDLSADAKARLARLR